MGLCACMRAGYSGATAGAFSGAGIGAGVGAGVTCRTIPVVPQPAQMSLRHVSQVS
jgi:hypothetical protein